MAAGPEPRVVVYGSSFFTLDGVSITMRAVLAHLLGLSTGKKLGSVMVVTADNPTPETLAKFAEDYPGVKVVNGIGGQAPLPGAEYSFGIKLDQTVMDKISAFNPTVIHLTNPDLLAVDLAQWVCMKLPDVALISSLHTNYVALVDFYSPVHALTKIVVMAMGWVYNVVPCTYVPSSYTQSHYAEYKWSTDLRVWGRGVDTKYLNPSKRSQAWRDSFDLTDDDVAVLYVSRLVPEKRPLLWADAVSAVSQEAVQARKNKVIGVCVGEGIGTVKADVGSKPGISCVGWKSGDELATIFASADVLMFPSETETFGRVTLEACASGIPCIVDQHCGGHLVTSGYNGFLVPTGGTAQDYAKELRKLAFDKELRKKCAKNARAFGETLEKDKLMDDMIGIYKAEYEQQVVLKKRAVLQTSRVRLALFGMSTLSIYAGVQVLNILTSFVMLFIKGPKSAEFLCGIKCVKRGFSDLFKICYSPKGLALLVAFALVLTHYKGVNLTQPILDMMA
ncbi:unnamed protein product [Chrysoparadoxa australica]